MLDARQLSQADSISHYMVNSSYTYTVVSKAKQIADDSFSGVDADCSDNHLADAFHHSSTYIMTPLLAAAAAAASFLVQGRVNLCMMQ